MCVRVSVCVEVTAFGLAWVCVCVSGYVCAYCMIVSVGVSVFECG